MFPAFLVSLQEGLNLKSKQIQILHSQGPETGWIIKFLRKSQREFRSWEGEFWEDEKIKVFGGLPEMSLSELTFVFVLQGFVFVGKNVLYLFYRDDFQVIKFL